MKSKDVRMELVGGEREVAGCLATLKNCNYISTHDVHEQSLFNRVHNFTSLTLMAMLVWVSMLSLPKIINFSFLI